MHCNEVSQNALQRGISKFVEMAISRNFFSWILVVMEILVFMEILGFMEILVSMV